MTFSKNYILYPYDNDCKDGFIMEYDASGYPIGCNPPPVLKIQVNAGKKINEKLSGFYISVSTISIPHALSGNPSYKTHLGIE